MNPIAVRTHQALRVQTARTTSLAKSSEAVGESSIASERTDAPKDGSALLRSLDSISRQAAVNSAIANDTNGLQAAKSAMENNLGELAENPEEFHAAMQKSFGNSYDKAKAETIRQQVLAGDFSWMPEIKVVDESVLQDQSGQQGAGEAFGAYSKNNDTIYLSRQMLTEDPDKAAQILTEEVGHGLDVRLNASDAAGDEGDIFSRLVGGEEITTGELADLKAENDSGTITVDGKEVEVEYGFFSKVFKAVTKPFKKIVDGVKDVAKKVWEGVKDFGKAIMESEILGTIMMVAQFIPIPIVQVIAKGYTLLKSAYQVGLGIKNGSVGMVLGGVAGIAGGAAGMGKALGASARFVGTATKTANAARTAGAAYMAVSQKNFAAAAGLASQAFGGASTQVGRSLGAVGNVASGVEQYRQGDLLGAINSGRSAYNGLTSNVSSASTNGVGPGDNKQSPATARSGVMGFMDNVTGSKTYQAIVDNVDTIRSVVKSVKNGDISAASQEFLSSYGSDLGISPDIQQDINEWAGVVDKVQDTVEMVQDKNYSAAIGRAAGLLGIPLNEANHQRLDAVFKLRDSVSDNNYANASRQAAVLSMQSGQPDLAVNFLKLANLLDGKLVAPAPAAADNIEAVNEAA